MKPARAEGALASWLGEEPSEVWSAIDAFQQLGEFFADPLLILEAEGRVVTGNRAACQLFDVDNVDSLAGRSLPERVQDPAKLTAYLTMAARSTSPVPGAITLRLNDGEAVELVRCKCGRVLSTAATPLLLLRCVDKAHADRDFIALNKQIRNLRREVEARKRAELALRRNEQKLQALFEAAPDATLICDRSGTILLTNRAFDALFGYASRALVGQPVERLVPTGVHKHQELRQTFFDRPSTRNLGGGRRLRARRADGTEVPVDIRLSPLETEDGPVVVAAVRDLTEQVQAEEARRDLERKMQQAQKLESLGVLAGGIAHDFNNLLLGVMGNADLVLLEEPLPRDVLAHVRDIVTSAQRAADLCKQLLAYSGRGRFVIEPADLSEVVREMAHLLEVSIHKKSRLRYDFAEQLPAVEVVLTQMRQVIMNLIINASDAIGDSPGTISVRTGAIECDEAYLSRTYVHADLAPGKYVFIEVTDTGRGIEPEAISRIFDPFYTTKSTGRGLGLAAVLGIVRSHRGALKVYSELNKGTTFKVLVPSAGDRRLTAPRPPRSQPAWTGHGTVLIVDDEASVRSLAEKILRRHGFDVVTADNGKVGIERFLAHRRDIVAVLLDVMMPVLGGEETFHELRRLDPALPIVFSSGYNEQDATVELADDACVRFVQKPYRVAELIEVLRSLLQAA